MSTPREFTFACQCGREYVFGPAGRATELEEVMTKIVGDFERRQSSQWGRFLLWLLRKTT